MASSGSPLNSDDTRPLHSSSGVIDINTRKEMDVTVVDTFRAEGVAGVDSVNSVAVDGRLAEETRLLKEKIVYYEKGMEDIWNLIAPLIHQSECSLVDIKGQNHSNCLQILQETARTLVQQNRTSNIRTERPQCSRLMSEEERKKWIVKYKKWMEEKCHRNMLTTSDDLLQQILLHFMQHSSDHLRHLSSESLSLSSSWPNDPSVPSLPYETAITFLLSRAADTLSHNSNLRAEMAALCRSMDDDRSATTKSDSSSQWRTPTTSALVSLREVIVPPVRRLWRMSTDQIRRLRSRH